jgi:hypothetical protein
VGSAYHFGAALRRSAHMRQSQEQGAITEGPWPQKECAMGVV